MSMHANPQLERTLIGVLLANGVPKVIGVALAEEGLRPEHLTVPQCRKTLEAIVALHDRGGHIELATVAEQLSRQTGAPIDQVVPALESMLGEAGMLGGLRTYVRDIKDLAAWESRRQAVQVAQAAVQTRDEEGLQRAETDLALAGTEHQHRGGDPKALADRFFHRLSNPDGRRWPWPLLKLNQYTRGGMRPGQTTFLSGPTRFGKSVVADMCLESAAAAGARCWLYMNEMSEQERMERVAARSIPLPLWRVSADPIADKDAASIVKWLGEQGPAFGIEPCDGWSAAEIARDAKHRRADVICVDLLDELPLLPGMSRRETTEESMRIFKQLAGEADCHVIVLGHLNRNRSSQSATIPIPTLGDIRESGMLANRAHNVMFVWREQDRETGSPQDDGLIILAKVRQGREGQVPVVFDGDRQRFREPDGHRLEAVA